jgi:hypothetical protein
MFLPKIVEHVADGTCAACSDVVVALADVFALVGEGRDVEKALVGFGRLDTALDLPLTVRIMGGQSCGVSSSS